ncbi:hypothetical protein M3Y97_00777100 [Aphelenchoides bicaudatus]|nr:hypothetical protein M3Y97_00777100 [Aphelenchoides bicaudatus]
MFESIPMPSYSDIDLAQTTKSIMIVYLYISFLFQSLTFALLFYLVHFRTPNAMAEYRRLLQVNIITAYLTEISFMLWLPNALPTNYHIISNGLIGQFGHAANYYSIFVVGTFMCSHFVAILGCVFYQITIIWPIKRHNVRVVVEFLLASDIRFHLIFICLSLVICFIISYYVINNIDVDFDPVKRLNINVPQDRILYNVFLQNSTNAIYIDFSRIGFLLTLFTCALVFFVSINIFGFVYYQFWSKRPTTTLKKTQQLQRSLHVCILVQTTSLTAFYMMPLELLLTARTLQMPYAFTVCIVAVASILTYSPVNHWILLFFVRHFRSETRKIIGRLSFSRNKVNTIFVQEREIRTLSFAN